MKAFFTLWLSSVLIFTICSGQDLQYPESVFPTHLKSLNGIPIELPKGMNLWLFPLQEKNDIPHKNTTPIHIRDNTTLKLDSLISNTEKRSFEYDEYGQVTYALAQRRADAFDVWVDTFAHAYEYNAAGNSIEYIRYNWSPQESQLVGNSKRIWQYDSNEREILFTNYTWIVDLQNWIATTRYGSIYEENILQELIGETWNTSTNNWELFSRHLFTHNENDLITSYSWYIWDTTTSEWLIEGKTEYQYNDDGLLVQEISQIWSNFDNEWYNTQKIEREYGSNGLASNVKYFSWDYGQDDWVGSLFIELQYDNADQLIVYTGYNWSTTQEVWIPVLQLLYTVDEAGNRLEEILNLWNPQTNSWQNVTKFAFGFNFDIMASSLVLPTSLMHYMPFKLYSVNKISVVNRYLSDQQTGNWAFFEQHEYHYSEIQLTSVDAMEQNEVMLFPNPTSGLIQISLDDLAGVNFTFQLYDINGRVLLEESIQSGASIDLSHLATGVYWYRLHSATRIMGGKVMKL